MKKIKMIGIPANAGGFYTGTEMTPKILRHAGLVQTLENNGITVIDNGDLSIPSYLPRHNVPPVRNWPSPRIVWEEIYNQSEDWFNEEEMFLIIGGDCSIVTGTVQSLYKRYKKDIHLIVIDAHIDSYKPSANTCMGAAASGLWFLLEENDFISPVSDFDGSNVTILGYQHEAEISAKVNKYSLSNMRVHGVSQILKKALKEIPLNRKIMVHLDLDAISKDELYAVYSPSDEGFTVNEMTQLLKELFSDPRVVGAELTEFFPLHDSDGSQSIKLIDMLVDVFKTGE